MDTCKILERLDSLEGVVTGIQGGYLQVANSVESFKRDTENHLTVMIKKMDETLKNVNSSLSKSASTKTKGTSKITNKSTDISHL